MKTTEKMINIKQLRTGSDVLTTSDGIFFSIQKKGTAFVRKNWGVRFGGIPITIDSIAEFFADNTPEMIYLTGSMLEYRFYDDKQYLTPLGVFYGVVNATNFFNKCRIGGKSLVAFPGDGSFPFDDFFCLIDGEKVQVKYVHELQNLIRHLRNHPAKRGQIDEF